MCAWLSICGDFKIGGSLSIGRPRSQVIRRDLKERKVWKNPVKDRNVWKLFVNKYPIHTNMKDALYENGVCFNETQNKIPGKQKLQDK